MDELSFERDLVMTCPDRQLQDTMLCWIRDSVDKDTLKTRESTVQIKVPNYRAAAKGGNILSAEAPTFVV